MAASLRNSSDWDKTVAAFRRAALLRQDVGSLRGLTLALVAQRQLRAALQAATRLMRLAPKSPHSHCVMGQVLAESENCEDKAERALRSALAIDPTEETAAGALAKLQAKTGKQELAAETCDAAMTVWGRGYVGGLGCIAGALTAPLRAAGCARRCGRGRTPTCSAS